MRYSVIIPSYNYGKYLPDSLGSALNQTISPNEIIIVDDGSTDETPDIINSYLSDSRVKYVRTENQGVSAARNTGIKIAQSDYLAFLDADDIWHQEKMELQLPLFNNPKVGVVYSLRRPFNEAGPIKGFKHGAVFRGDILPHLMTHNFICLSSAVVRRECIERVGLFDVRLSSHGEDMDLWLRIAAEGYEFEYINLVLVDYRAGGEASSLENWNKRYYCNKLLFKQFFSNPKYQKIISYKMRRQAWAALWAKRGFMLFEQGYRLKALKYGVISAFYAPLKRMAWGVIGKIALPKKLVSKYREYSNRQLK